MVSPKTAQYECASIGEGFEGMRLGFCHNLLVVEDLAVAKIDGVSFARFCDFIAKRMVILEAALNVVFRCGDCWSMGAHDYLPRGC